MRTKTKLSLGVGLLFIFIVVLAFLGATQIDRLATDTKNILVANYNTLDYSRQMIIALDEKPFGTEAVQKFNDNLQKQLKNVTELGEKELTEKLETDFKAFQINKGSGDLQVAIRKDLTDIMLLNMHAIQRKSQLAQQTADKGYFWVLVIGTLCFLIAFTLLVNLPGSIANPIQELTEKIRAIANKNYDQKVYLQGSSEFAELGNAFNTMAAKLQEYQGSNLANILFEKKRIETLINNMRDPVIGINEDKWVLFANTEALKVSGLKAEELIGRQVTDVALQNDLIRFLVKDLSTKPTGNGTMPMKIFADGKESYFEREVVLITITPTGEKKQQNIGFVILLRNITPFKELDFAKTHFIATVSHELKTPISSIKMSVDLMDNEKVGGLNDEQKGLLSGIKEDTARLLKITGELLNMSQVESGNMQLKLASTEVAGLVEYAVSANKVLADRKHISIATTIAAGLPRVMADAEKTIWVLGNLLSNAIRYSYEGSNIVVTAGAVSSGVFISVKDSGQGIVPEYKDKIFERYFRVPGSVKEGTGLGLAISKEIMEAEGGTITVESEYGLGSTFTIFLPTQA